MDSRKRIRTGEKIVELDYCKVGELLRQRNALIMLDRILELEPFKKITATKNITQGEAVFKGHFPNQPLMPGVFILESMIEAGVLLITLSDSKIYHIRNQKWVPSIRRVRFLQPVLPGQQLLIVAEVIEYTENTFSFNAETRVDGKTTASGQLILKIKD